MRKFLWITLAALLAALVVPAAYAGSLDGQPVEIDYLYPSLGSLYQVLGNGTVTAGGYTVNSFGLNNYTVTDNQIILQNISGSPVPFLTGSFNGYELTETGGSPVTITGVTLDSATDVSGVNSSDISFDSTNIWLNMQGITIDSGQEVVLDFTTSGSSTTPEPGTGTLLLAGLGLVALVAMKRGRNLLGAPRRS